MLSLLIVGIFGTTVLTIFFAQSINSTVKPYWLIIPLIAVVFIGIFILKTAIGDRD